MSIQIHGTSSSTQSPSRHQFDWDKFFALKAKPWSPGDTCYLLDKEMFDKYEKFANGDIRNPGPIDNSKLLTPPDDVLRELKSGKFEINKDFIVLPEEAWNALIKYFNIKDKKHVIKRCIIREETESKLEDNVEFHHVKVLMYLRQMPTTTILSERFSRRTTLKELESIMRRYYEVDENFKTYLYNQDTRLDTSAGTLADYERKVFSLKVFDTKLETKTERDIENVYTKYTRGACGLSNLGNTCYMNSALQCLSNVPPLTKYISTTEFKNISSKHYLATTLAFDEIIETIWSGNVNSLVPEAFKEAFDENNRQFQNTEQQDSHEFMACLLQNMHECLKQNKNAQPILGDVEWKNYWSIYQIMNDSIIMETFHGLLKSSVTCPDCTYVSNQFDPFCSLSLPLRQEIEIDVVCVLFAGDRSQESSLQITSLSIPMFGTIGDISEKVVGVVLEATRSCRSIDPLQLVVAKVSKNLIQKVYDRDDPITEVLKDIYVYETPEKSIPVYLLEVGGKRYDRNYFGRPFYIKIRGWKCSDIYETVNKYLSKFLRNCVPDEMLLTERFTLVLTDLEGKSDLETLELAGSIEIKRHHVLAAHISTKVKNTLYDFKKTKFYMETISKAKTETLTECIDRFLSTERLEESDVWNCPSCKIPQQAFKKLDICKLPKVLIFHLKRFMYFPYRAKLDFMVDFPIKGLDMSPFVITDDENKSILYDLISVCNHTGQLLGGHYTTCAKNCERGKWYTFNDSNVSFCATSNVNKNNKLGYILLYMRRTD